MHWALVKLGVVVWALSALGPEACECPRLQAALWQIATASDPVAAARHHGIALLNGRVRVIVELIPGAALPPDAPLAIEARYEHLVQALVAPKDLCRLARDPAVAEVRLPYPHAPDIVPPPPGDRQ